MTTLVPLIAVLVISAVAALDVHVPEVPVVALYGQDVTLHCTFNASSPVNLSELSVYWELADTKRSIHSFSAGRDQLTEQADTFANRTSLFNAQLGSGNASLLLRNVRIADDGVFSCFVSLGTFGSGALVLQVAAPYTKPQVTLAPDLNLRPGDEVSLTCVAYGGFPQAQVQWQDGMGRNMTDNVTTSQVASEEGLFNVRSVLRVVLEPNSTYSCRLHNPLLGEEGHASVTITGQNTTFPAVALWVTVGLAICLLGLLIALAVVCRRKIKESCEEAAAGEACAENGLRVVQSE
ncbi:CD276 antigen-like isoform X1 [Paramormyrops kingsleyae]|uniref:CD276 molecule n=1 Tax=Paramormyrops kingsleyae TaxID=1676925 RepID=A0A3B3R3A5_9TELE|nr:CD276 antigen-like isoform X1 [Paramormyrops kingsleyae]XP_023675620.1 CD276 antigen-like isoform X1 [Paramormyrops kingsleyae]XP_023675621.1 CD276 antigen-like isoform X1 [Paramormyrops kingsleyae]XP_023675622.1 CD276 antigen-like isoform X1 [Paramormyrops kingsleyae]